MRALERMQPLQYPNFRLAKSNRRPKRPCKHFDVINLTKGRKSLFLKSISQLLLFLNRSKYFLKNDFS